MSIETVSPWRLPLVKLLLNSAAVQTLRLIAQQFPLLRAPSVVDAKPRMQPDRALWQTSTGSIAR